MNAGHKALALAFAAAFALAAQAPAAQASPAGGARQSEPQRRPQGPVAGPVIKLPRGEGASEERTQPQPGGSRGEGARAAYSTQKWEYCAITGFVTHQKGFSISSPTQVPAAFIRYFAGGTEEVEGQTEEEALANAFAKLGDDGWELTALRTDLSLNEGNGKSRAVYFFKRPKGTE